ncbi:hypothetical protein FB45DRAFT_931555 [Roridomyces roridus]|uniref:MYND-type domain-containing protein n=1 Tax=Roridomyces roridus TaxID=1738132 RepID=A0AAD7BDR6_9AGAR|nr:hypothetical protein FB45DRAFT_931555 [Roridomyces roridus]
MPSKKRTPAKKPLISAAGPPDVQTDPMGWMHATDLVAKRRFDTSLPLDPDPCRGGPESFFEPLMNSDVLQEIVGFRRFACGFHYTMSKFIVELLTEKDFESRWLALGTDGQTKHFILAFKNLQEKESVGPMVHVFDNPKLDAPELCLDELTRDSGRGFLDLMNVFLLPNNDGPPKQPFIFPNERFDAIIGWKSNDTAPNRRSWLGLRRMMRTRYISSFVSTVLHSTEGEIPKVVLYAYEHDKTRSALDGMRETMSMAGVTEDEYNRWRKDQTERRKEMKRFCDTCLKPEDKIQDGKMSICAPCKAVDRDVRYCDKACQKQAWKSHKQSCGKLLDIDDTFNDTDMKATSTRQDIPPVASGHRRSADLLKQISLLNDYAQTDYLCRLPPSVGTDEDDFDAITLDHAHSAATFMIMRGYAMSSSGPRAEAALLYVYRVLQKAHSTEDVLRKQLRREYGVSFDNVLAALARGEKQVFKGDVTRGEIDDALSHLKDKGRFKEQLKDFEIGAGPTFRFVLKVGPKQEVGVTLQYPLNFLRP